MVLKDKQRKKQLFLIINFIATISIKIKNIVGREMDGQSTEDIQGH